MQRATFTIRRKGKKIGTASFIGKSWKAAKATGARILRAIANPTPESYEKVAKKYFDRMHYTRSLRASAKAYKKRQKKKAPKSNRKKNLNFGQRMARIRARKTKARKRR